MSLERPPSRFSSYRSALIALSARTQTPLPSLIASFAVLHELTAIVPLVSLFFCARGLGIGEQAVTLVRNRARENPNHGWIPEKGAQWVDEGEKWAERVGRRYGVFGYTKGDASGREDMRVSSQVIASDVANAVFAYGATKLLLPARIGVSLFFAPAFSRRVVEPFRSRMTNIWKRRPPS